MSRREALRDLVVLRPGERAGGIHQRSARLDVPRRRLQYLVLYLRQAVEIRRRFELDLRLAADNSKPGARYVAEHPVRLRKLRVEFRRVVLHCGDYPYPEPGRSVLDEAYAHIVEVHAVQLSVVAHQLREGEALPAGSRADVKHGLVDHRTEGQAAELRRDILNMEQSLPERRAFLDVAGLLQANAVLKPGIGFRFYPVL